MGTGPKGLIEIGTVSEMPPDQIKKGCGEVVSKCHVHQRLF